MPWYLSPAVLPDGPRHDVVAAAGLAMGLHGVIGAIVIPWAISALR
jgi:putative effector of murein hydrolase